MSPVVAGLLAALLKCKKLIAKIDECGVLALAAQREFEQAAVEGKGLLDVAHLERDVVQSDRAGFAGLGHGGCLQMSLVEDVVRFRLPANVGMRTREETSGRAKGRSPSHAKLRVTKPVRLTGAGAGYEQMMKTA